MNVSKGMLIGTVLVGAVYFVIGEIFYNAFQDILPMPLLIGLLPRSGSVCGHWVRGDRGPHVPLQPGLPGHRAAQLVAVSGGVRGGSPV